MADNRFMPLPNSSLDASVRDIAPADRGGLAAVEARLGIIANDPGGNQFYRQRLRHIGKTLDPSFDENAIVCPP